MRSQRCPVRACGAVVLMLPLDSGEMAVDPQPLEVVVAMPDEPFRMATGYRPHWQTCVDVSTRGKQRRPSR